MKIEVSVDRRNKGGEEKTNTLSIVKPNRPRTTPKLWKGPVNQVETRHWYLVWKLGLVGDNVHVKQEYTHLYMFTEWW